MQPLIIIVSAALLSAILCAALLPVLRRLALVPADARSAHKRPTPQGGGIAVVLAILCVALAVLMQRQAQSGAFPVVLAATLGLTILGSADDMLHLPITPRLLLQLMAVSAAFFAFPEDLRIVPWMPLALERIALVLGGLWFVNLVNFMDGLDWMTCAGVIPAAVTLGIAGLFGALSAEATIVAFALAGALIGFAPFNRPAARLFLGDAGSLPIGLLSGWLLASLAVRGYVAAALLIPLYYVSDTTITLARRIARGETIWRSHRMHFYQQAFAGGKSVIAIDARVFGVNAALGMLALLTIWKSEAAICFAALAAGGGLVAWLLRDFSGRR